MTLETHVVIRTATLGDERQLAQVHIQSWQEAYKGLLPQEYLDQLPSQMNDRVKMWISILSNPKRWAWVAESNHRIVGFILFGPPRDPDKEEFIELGAIYLLASEKGKGIGFSLLSAGFNKMKDLGYKRSYCWVLENNPTIKFYERSGANYTGQMKEDEIGGKKFNELAYEWDSLSVNQMNSGLVSFQKKNYFILTGAPGVGKTSLRQELELATFKCVSEPARIILAEQRARNGNAVPEKNPKLFCEMLLQQSIQDYETFRNYVGPVIFDRGVPDNIAYAGCFNLDTFPYMTEAKKYAYNKTVILLPPWKEIYTTDEERRMNFDQVCEFHKLICAAYRGLGYNLVEVPFGTLQDRASFVKKLVI